MEIYPTTRCLIHNIKFLRYEIILKILLLYMESFEHLLPGNVLILGEKNKELELDSKVRKNLQNGDVFYNKSNNAVISNIVVTPSAVYVC